MSRSHYEQKIMYAFYIKENISEKIKKPTRPSVEQYLDKLKKEKKTIRFGEYMYVAPKTIADIVALLRMDKKVDKNTLASMLENTLDKIAFLFGCKYQSLEVFYEELGNTSVGDKYALDMVKFKSLHHQPLYIHPRAEAFSGSWDGTSFELEKLMFPIIINLDINKDENQNGTKMNGTGKIHYCLESDGRKIDTVEGLNFDGKIIENSYLRLNYHNSKNGVVHFGTIYLKLFNNGLIMEGRFTGVGLTTGDIVGGEVKLEKQPSRIDLNDWNK